MPADRFHDFGITWKCLNKALRKLLDANHETRTMYTDHCTHSSYLLLPLDEPFRIETSSAARSGGEEVLSVAVVAGADNTWYHGRFRGSKRRPGHPRIGVIIF